jgi:hypothetical protein
LYGIRGVCAKSLRAVVKTDALECNGHR